MMSKQNAEEDYIKTPISVLAYIGELEIERDALKCELMTAQASLRACYNASAGALDLVNSERQPNR